MTSMRIAAAPCALPSSLAGARAATLHADFDGDGFGRLAVGVEGEDAGAVQVIHGSAGGLTGHRSQRRHQDSPGVADRAEVDDLFGLWLAAGLTGAGSDHWQQGAHGLPDTPETKDFLGSGLSSANVSAGAVHVLYGGIVPFDTTTDALWDQDSPMLPDTAEPSDQFGGTLAR